VANYVRLSRTTPQTWLPIFTVSTSAFSGEYSDGRRDEPFLPLLEVATALTVRRLYPFGLSERLSIPPTRELARLPRSSERGTIVFPQNFWPRRKQFVGVQSGLLDQIASLFGTAWHCEYGFPIAKVDTSHHDWEAILSATPALSTNWSRRITLTDAELDVPAQKLGANHWRALNSESHAANKRNSRAEYESRWHVISKSNGVVAAKRRCGTTITAQFGQYMSKAPKVPAIF